MTKTRLQINRDSNLKRGMVRKSYTIDQSTANLIDAICDQQKISRRYLLKEAIQLFFDRTMSTN